MNLILDPVGLNLILDLVGMYPNLDSVGFNRSFAVIGPKDFGKISLLQISFSNYKSVIQVQVNLN
jgi:hypothetical protein